MRVNAQADAQRASEVSGARERSDSFVRALQAPSSKPETSTGHPFQSDRWTHGPRSSAGVLLFCSDLWQVGTAGTFAGSDRQAAMIIKITDGCVTHFIEFSGAVQVM